MYPALAVALALLAVPIVALAADPDSMRAEPDPPSLTRTVGNGLKALASDAGYVLTSPFRLKREGALWTAGIVATAGLIYLEDEEILNRLLRNPRNGVYEAVIDVGDKIERVGYMGKTIPYYLGFALIAREAGWEGAEVAAMQIVESHLIAGGIRNGSKWAIGRRRPFEDKGPYFFEWNGGTSLPSGHTSVAFEIATIVSRHVDRRPVTIGLYGLATCIAFQRIESGGHWPSDVFLSAALGTTVARTVVKRWEGREDESKTGVILEPRGNGLALTYRF